MYSYYFLTKQLSHEYSHNNNHPQIKKRKQETPIKNSIKTLIMVNAKRITIKRGKKMNIKSHISFITMTR